MADEKEHERKEYIAAVRRGRRDDAPSEWQEILRQIEGLEVDTGASHQRCQIRATRKALSEARKKLGDYLYIEPIIEHKKL